MGISIFAKRAFLSRDSSHLKRISSMIRADQICEATEARLNPKKDYQNDVCVYVKPDIGPDFKFEGRRAYLDIVDGWYYGGILKDNPQVGAIVCSEQDYFYMARENIPNKIVLIPQHHCNYKREKRERKEITRVGVVGTRDSFRYIPAELELLLKVRGMELVICSDFFTRSDIVDFYKTIDIQIIWRPYRKKLGNPLKMVNACSFGIPSIAFDEIYFREMGNCYIAVKVVRLLVHLEQQ